MLARAFFIIALLLILGMIHLFFALPLAAFLSFLSISVWLLMNLYPDKFLLHFFRARETIETDHPEAYRLARAQVHKFKLSSPRIYTYSGFFHRAYCLSARGDSTFLVEKKVLAAAKSEELEALFFALALETHDGVAKRHTLALLLLAIVWAVPLKLVSLLGRSSSTLNLTVQYIVGASSDALFKIVQPASIWRAFLLKLNSFQLESARLREFNARLDQPRLENSPSRMLNFKFYSSSHTTAQQMILSMESAHHYLDFLDAPTLSGEGHA
jgi:uncharacterized protein (DUF1778 family)